MKKLLCVLLVALMLPLVSFADDSVVGTWYMLYDKSLFPEMAPNFQNADIIVSAYSFLEDGSILLSENDIFDKTGNYTSAVSGKWETDSSGYTYNIVGFGSGKCFVKDDLLHLQLNNANMYLVLRRMIPYDPYHDYVIK